VANHARNLADGWLILDAAWRMRFHEAMESGELNFVAGHRGVPGEAGISF